MKAFAEGGPAPGLPAGRTASERRGRELFVDAPWDPPNEKGTCALCHSGPMLNTANQFSYRPNGCAAKVWSRLMKETDENGVWHPKNLRAAPKTTSPWAYHMFPIDCDSKG